MIDYVLRTPRDSRVRSDAAHAVFFALAYFAGGEVGYALSLGPSVGGTFWPPAGIALAVFLASPRHLWPQLLAAGLAANFVSDWLHGQSLPASIGFAAANLSEPILGAWLLRKFYRREIDFTRLHDVVALAIVVTFGSALFSSAIGATAAELWTESPPGFLASWRTWWIGDTVGALVLTPCIFRIMTGWRNIRAVPVRVFIEAALFGVALTIVTQIVFYAPPASLAAPFLVFPVLIWGSLRFGPVGVGAALCLVVILTSRDTAMGLGPFAEEQLSLGDRLVALQIYVGVMAISFHALGVLWEERARTAAQLRLVHSGLAARHRRIVEQSPLAILVLERGGRVREVNPAWHALWATSPSSSAIEDRPWEAPRVKPLLERAFAGEVVELPEREIIVHGADGTEPRRVQGFAYPIKDDGGGVAEVVLIERDITDELEAKRRREQLLEAERFARSEAERASQLKDEFLATLSHELRTPLNAIIGWSHILRRTTDGAARSQAIETIERNAHAQARIIGDLLDMSRIMAGKVSLTLAPVELADVVTGAADALRPVADGKGVSLSVDAGRPACVLGDASRLQQVVTNLLDNAIKFTPPGSSVTVRIDVDSQSVRVVVTDTGEGISPAFLPNVFDRFRQADQSTTRRYAGLGLGLGIAKQIVEMHGGTISAESDGTNRGAVFTVTMPVLADGGWSGDANTEYGLNVPLTDLRVLVVDDDADARELLRRLLSEHGCDVSTASSAEDALTQVVSHEYDLLLTDIGMPGTDGYELVARLRSQEGRAFRAIAVTAFARPEDRERALSAGFDGHLTKPVTPGQLVHVISEVMAR